MTMKRKSLPPKQKPIGKCVVCGEPANVRQDKGKVCYKHATNIQSGCGM